MWIVTAFDLPVKSPDEAKIYRSVRKKILSLGFSPIQKSIFFRFCNSTEKIVSIRNNLLKSMPINGSLLVCSIPDTQWNNAAFMNNGILGKLPPNPDPWLIF